MIFASTDVLTCTVLLLVLALLGEGLTRITSRMLALRRSIRFWAIALGFGTGALFFFAAAGEPNAPQRNSDVLSRVFISGLASLVTCPVWYLIVAFLTLLYQYIFVANWRVAENPRSTSYSDKTGRGLALFGGLAGAFIGLFTFAAMQNGSPNVSDGAGVLIVGACIFAGSSSLFAIGLFLSFVSSLLTGSRRVGASLVAEIQKSAADRQTLAEETKRESEKRRAELAVQAEGVAARKQLADFYAANKFVLADQYPPALMEAFLRAEMPNSLAPAELWAICQKKIAEMQPFVLEGHKKQLQEQDRLSKMKIRGKQIDAEIRSCRDKIAQVEKSGFDAEFIEDETHGLQIKIRQLEEQKELLSTLNSGGVE